MSAVLDQNGSPSSEGPIKAMKVEIPNLKSTMEHKGNQLTAVNKPKITKPIKKGIFKGGATKDEGAKAVKVGDSSLESTVENEGDKSTVVDKPKINKTIKKGASKGGATNDDGAKPTTDNSSLPPELFYEFQDILQQLDADPRVEILTPELMTEIMEDEVNVEITAKKRGAAKANDDASPQKKKAKKAEVEAAEEGEEDDEVVAGHVTPKGRGPGKGGKAGPLTPPKTPKKAATKAKESAAASDEDEEAVNTIKKGAARKQVAARKIAEAIPIPTSLETATAGDKLIWNMKAAGKSWLEIGTAWGALTGDDRGNSSLTNRYARLKKVFLVLKGEDTLRFIQSESEVDAEIDFAMSKMNAEKWGKVIKAMEDKGTTEKYTTLFLQTKSEEFKANPKLVASIKASAQSNANNSDNAATTSDNDMEEGAAIEAEDDVNEEGNATSEAVGSVVNDTAMEDAPTVATGENGGEIEHEESGAAAEEI